MNNFCDTLNYLAESEDELKLFINNCLFDTLINLRTDRKIKDLPDFTKDFKIDPYINSLTVEQFLYEFGYRSSRVFKRMYHEYLESLSPTLPIGLDRSDVNNIFTLLTYTNDDPSSSDLGDVFVQFFYSKIKNPPNLTDQKTKKTNILIKD